MERPIFLLGTQRSGTTLMRLILDSHRRIAIGHESGFMRAVEATKNLPDYIYGERWYQRFGIGDDDMNDRLRDFYSGIFGHYAGSRGKPRWGEKTPDNMFFLNELEAIFPNAQFVCTVRQPGAVVASLKRWDWDFETALAYWIRANTIARQATQRLPSDKWHLVRYEDLVGEPEGVLRTVLNYLGEEWDENVLRHHKVQLTRTGGIEVEGDNRDDRAIDQSRVDAWRDDLNTDQVARIEVETADLREYFRFDYRFVEGRRS